MRQITRKKPYKVGKKIKTIRMKIPVPLLTIPNPRNNIPFQEGNISLPLYLFHIGVQHEEYDTDTQKIPTLKDAVTVTYDLALAMSSFQKKTKTIV